MKALKKIFASPYFLSLIPFLVIIIAFPPGFNKFSLKQESRTQLTGNHFVSYYDLDSDGSSEKIIAFNQENTTAITVNKSDSFVDQWNLRGSFDFWFKSCLYIIGDRNNDYLKELYVFTLNRDTILLHCIPDFRNPSFSVKNRIIAVAGKGNKVPDPFIIPAEMDDLDGDGVKELIFGIGSGFSVYPRNVFAYFISKDSLIVSPESSYFINGILQTDINDDGKKEIIPHGYATSNVSPEQAIFHDYSSFMMILDQNLKFLYNPIEFKGRYSVLTPFLIKVDQNLTLAWLNYSATNASTSTVYFVNTSGLISRKIPLNFNAFSPNSSPSDVIGNGLTLMSNEKGVSLLNNDFKIVKNVTDVSNSSQAHRDLDLDGDGIKEILFLDIEKSLIFIYREGLRQGVSASLELSPIGPNNISLKTEIKEYPLISIQSGFRQYLFSYTLNPFYPFYYLYYPGIYLSILVFALIIRNIQKNQIRKKYETEKRISELQLALIRNQLDPHFTLNVINSIIYSVEFSEKEQAGEQLRQFANLYRNMLLSAGSTRRTISEELDFVNNYLLLEKMRFKDTFNYKISVSEDIDRNYLIPKLLIQIHAENAVKHGLAQKEEGRKLDIEIKKMENSLVIDITDNGVGRDNSAIQFNSSTGKGLAIMDELYSIYNKYYNEKVSSRINDLYDADGNPSGTRVSIRINKQHEKN